MLKGILSLYSPKYPKTIVYMLQSCEYKPEPYLKWFWRTNDFAAVVYRRTLDSTRAAKWLLIGLYSLIATETVAALLVGIFWRTHGLEVGLTVGCALFVAYPLVVAHIIVLPLILGRIFIVAPRHRAEIKKSEQIFRDHPATKVAIAGSYGKTSMKEMLLTILSEGKKVAATPANKNVAISHANYASRLSGDEDVLLIEYGEGAPGDVTRFAKTTHPTHAVITGLAPAHLDQYKTLEAAADDIFSVTNFVKPENTYVNHESQLLLPYTNNQHYKLYDRNGALGWQVSNVHIGLDGTKFTLKKGSRILSLHSGLLGRHQIGPLSFAAAFATELGMTDEQIKIGVSKTVPFEHRMQPYHLNGAWIIDDSYNGNIEGIRAGTKLLSELEARRKIYVTPGLVDQGSETSRVHREVGKLIAAANPDKVILMKNSAASDIQKGLQDSPYKGELIIEPDPLKFYTNIQLFVAAEDLVMMQNDWTDNYN